MTERTSDTELLLNQFLDGELEAESCALLEQRLAGDVTLQADLEQRKMLRLRLRTAVYQLPIPRELDLRVRMATTARHAIFAPPGWWRRLQLGGALAFLLLVGLVSWQLLRTPSLFLSDLPPSIAAVMRIGIGKHVSCVKERAGADGFALGSFSSEVPGDDNRLLDAAQRALPGDFKVLERHVCGTRERRFAHLVLSTGDGYLSVLVTARAPDDPGLPDSSLVAATVGNLQVYAVRQNGMDVGAFALPQQYAFVVSDAGPRENLRYARNVAAAMQTQP